MDRIAYQKYLIKIKSALLTHKNREFLIFLFFFFVSASFWLLQTLNETFDVEIRIPLKMLNVPSNVVITSSLPENLKVVIRDKGTVMVRYLYAQDMRPLQVDYKAYDTGILSGRVVLSMQDIQKEVQSQLLPSSRIVAVRPDTLEFYFNRGARKKVPVKLAGRVETSPEFYLQQVTCVPDSVVVYAPLGILDTISAVYTSPIEITNLSSDLKIDRNLHPVRGTKFEPTRVDVNLGVDLYTEKTVEIPVIGINFPGSHDLRTFPSKVNVTFKIGMSHFKEIGPEDFVLTVTYEELMKNGNGAKIPLHLKSVPPGVSNVRIHPAEVEYLIEQIAEE